MTHDWRGPWFQFCRIRNDSVRVRTSGVWFYGGGPIDKKPGRAGVHRRLLLQVAKRTPPAHGDPSLYQIGISFSPYKACDGGINPECWNRGPPGRPSGAGLRGSATWACRMQSGSRLLVAFQARSGARTASKPLPKQVADHLFVRRPRVVEGLSVCGDPCGAG
jgi:hypothetical protein